MTNFIQENTARINETRALVGRVQDQINLQELDCLRMRRNIDRLVKEKAALTSELISEGLKRRRAERAADASLMFMYAGFVIVLVNLGWTVYGAW